MKTVTSHPGGLGKPPEPRMTYGTGLLLHDVLRIVAFDVCEIVITTANAGSAVRAPRDLLTFSVRSNGTRRRRPASSSCSRTSADS
jgi:hypothetical protein